MINLIMRIPQCSRLVTRSSSISRYLSAGPVISFKPFVPVTFPSRSLSTNKGENDKKFKWPFHMTMTSEQKEAKEKRIEEMKQEEPPKSIFAKVKYYLKRYWYIAVPAHALSSTAWFVSCFLIVKSGVDVVALLQFLHTPDIIVEKIQNTPPSAGVAVVALILYKLATPLRYATTLVFIQATFWMLRRMGKLRTVREVEYKVRSEYEKTKHFYGRKMYRYRHLGVRDASRKNSVGQVHSQQKSGSTRPESPK